MLIQCTYNMVVGRTQTSSVCCLQNLPNTWDLCEIHRYKDANCFSYVGSQIKWTDSLEMLKIFMKNVICQAICHIIWRQI